PRVKEACVDSGSRWPEIGYERRDHVCLRVLCGGGRCRQHRDRRKGEHKQTRLPPTRERGNATHELRPLSADARPMQRDNRMPKIPFRGGPEVLMDRTGTSGVIGAVLMPSPRALRLAAQ